MKSKFIDKLAKCECCPWKCGVNRIKKETGICGISSDIHIAHSGLHFGEEPPISGTKGSGTIFFSGCNLKCVFCQNFQISQDFSVEKNKIFSVAELADEIIRLQDMGAHNINFVSPSHMIYQIADSLIIAKSRGLKIPVVYNTNCYDSVDALKDIEGLIDIYLPDLKYMSDELAKKYSYAKNYVEISTLAVNEMFRQVGNLKEDDKGVAVSGLLVRYLVLPGCVEDGKKVLEFLYELSKEMYVSVMSQYFPQYKSYNYPEINHPLTIDEYNDITDFAIGLGFENLFLQDRESQKRYIPDFSKNIPFENH